MEEELYEVTTKGYQRYHVLATSYDAAVNRVRDYLIDLIEKAPVLNCHGDLNPFYVTETIVSIDEPVKVEKVQGTFLR